VQADEHGGLWITLPSGRRYYRPAEPVLDHPGLVAEPDAGPDGPPATDPDPPAENDDLPLAEDLDKPPF
jgi:hypothetical protein